MEIFLSYVLIPAVKIVAVVLIVSGAVAYLTLLERKLNSFEYADPRLEALSPAQKHLLRLGPEYAARVQGKLYELGIALGFSPEELS